MYEDKQMTETQETPIPDYPRGITFEQVWAAQMNTDRQMKETDWRMKELQDQMGSLNNRFGEMVEHLVAIIDDSLRCFILKQGFYLIEQTGDTVRINVPKGFKPKKW